MENFSRRELLRKDELSSVFGSSPPSWASKTEFVPAIVIGSGFGGAVASLRLAEAGVRHVVLERGRRWPVTPEGDTFATIQQPDGRAAWFSENSVIQFPPPTPIDKFAGIMERINGENMSVLVGAGVGGGSLIYSAILVQPLRENFERVFPGELSYDELDSIYYPRALSILAPEPIPDDILSTDFYQSKRVNFEQAKRAGFPTRRIDLGIDWNVVRQEIRGARIRSTIAGQLTYGQNSGSNKSLDKSYLAMSEASGFTDVLPLHVVDEISEFSQSGFYVVSANEINEKGEVLTRRHFACKYLFMAAGSCHTTALLVKNKAKGGLPRLNDEVGKNWGSNGEFTIIRVGLPPTNPGTGGPAGQFIMDINTPFGQVGVTELVTPPLPPLPKPPPPLEELPESLRMFLKQIQPYSLSDMATSSAISIGMGTGPAVGEFVYDPATDDVTLKWPAVDDPRLANSVKSALYTLDTLNDANFIGDRKPIGVPNFQETGHPVGGVVAGKACDFFGRVKDHPGLYVVDGAFVPGGSTAGVNPALTIAALAERSMEKIIKEDILNGKNSEAAGGGQEKGPPPIPLPPTFPPGVDPSTYKVEIVEHLLKQTAYISTLSIPIPNKPNIPILAPGSSDPDRILGVRVFEEPHRFNVTLGVKNLVGKTHADMALKWMLTPDDYYATPDREPPATELDRSRSSQRFVMQDATFTFDEKGENRFDGFGTGMIFPVVEGGEQRLSLGACGVIGDGHGIFKGTQGCFALNSSMRSTDAQHFQMLLQIMDPSGKFKTSAELSSLGSIPDPDHGSTYVTLLGETDPEFPIKLNFSPEGKMLGATIHKLYRLVHLDFDKGRSGDSLRSKATIGPVVGTLKNDILFDPLNPKTPGTPGSPVPWRTVNTLLSFFDKDRTTIGTIKVNIVEGRGFTTELEGAPMNIFQLAGFGPFLEGTGLFSDAAGMLSVNAAVSFFPSALWSTYVLRFFDPDRKLLAMMRKAWI